MLILIIMLLIGLFAAVWGFMMCFLPAQWDRITEAMSFAGRWTEPRSKPPHPLMRFGNRVAGLVILAIGCWFAYVAASEVYLVLIGRVTSRAMHPVRGTIPSSSTPALTALSIIVLVIGLLMAVIPAKAVAVFERVWPAGRSVTAPVLPKLTLLVRIFGLLFAALAMISLI